MLQNTAAFSLVRQFIQLQEERAHTYRRLEEGHKVYLNSGPDYEFLPFRQLVHNVTQDFQRISKNIITIENNLRTSGHDSFASIIASIQDCEKKKLEMTAHLQLARQMVAESDDGEIEKSKEREIRTQLGQLIEEINDHLTEIRYELENNE